MADKEALSQHHYDYITNLVLVFEPAEIPEMAAKRALRLSQIINQDGTARYPNLQTLAGRKKLGQEIIRLADLARQNLLFPVPNDILRRGQPFINHDAICNVCANKMANSPGCRLVERWQYQLND